MDFDLKTFRESKGYSKQKEFAALVNYKSTMISQMESGQKPVSDKLLLKIEEVFEINLDEYKKYDRNKKGLYLKEIIDPLKTLPHSKEHGELLGKSRQLSEKLSEMENSDVMDTPELMLAKENNRLLRELVTCMKEILRRVPEEITF